MRMRRSRSVGFAVVLSLVIACAFAAGASAKSKVLLVGTYKGVAGQYKTIQAAVNAAKPGDWILVGPGDYKTSTGYKVKGQPQLAAGVLITKPDIYLRGMNRNTVVVDGTKPGSSQCSNKASAQNKGPAGLGGHLGLNGILVWNANNVWIQNLTACNFLSGAGDSGNEIWWDALKVGPKNIGHGYYGSYLNATSTYYDRKNPNFSAAYGIFSSRWNGGTWDNTYASNQNDSAYYIGACQQVCNQVLNNGWGEYSALGYSGSNSGGSMLIENSQFDDNTDGFSTNSQNGDNPPPQNGACPVGVKPPVKGAPTCWVFTHNYVHNNNNPNVPAIGSAAQGPDGTGMTISGGRNDTVIDNRFVDNDAWGIVFVAYPDSGEPCNGGTLNSPLLGKGSCLFDEWSDHLLNNTFTDNGSFGNPTNGQFDQLNLESHPSDCFSGNKDTNGPLDADAQKLQTDDPTCGTTDVPPNYNIPFLDNVLCDSGDSLPPFGCQPGEHYPKRDPAKIVMHKLPTSKLPTMPNPCKGVPKNAWCSSNKGGGSSW
jgi:hypothetical protein